MSEKDKAEPSTPCGSLPTGELPEQAEKEVRARYGDVPAPLPPGHEIHRRQNIPPVPAGEEVPDDAPSPPIDLD